MTTLVDVFLAQRDDLQTLLERGDTNGLRGHFRLLEKEYGESEARSDCERGVAGAALALATRMAECFATASLDIAGKSSTVSGPSPTEPTVVVMLTFVAALSALLGATTMSVVFILGLGALGCWAVAGWPAGLVRRWPFSRLATHLPNIDDREAAERATLQSSVTTLLHEIEGNLRKFDLALASARADLANAATAAMRSCLREPVELQFIQDLAEAAARGNAEYALMLTQDRLEPLAQALGLTLVEAQADTLRHFSVDGAANNAVQPLRTLRPAILDGERCLARGYARYEGKPP